jgi:glycosyltransferase involved in cell wall biosynthesis
VRKFAINGDFLLQNATGVQRYAWNLTWHLDKICKGMDIKIVISRRIKNKPALNNIKVVLFGYGKGILWEQSWFAVYALLSGRQTLNFSCSMPLLNSNGITVIHDIRNALHPDWIPKNNLRAKIVAKWFVLQSWFVCKFSKKLITVSESSKKEIYEHYNINPDRIIVVPNGWQHIKKAEQKAGNIDYYFALSTAAKHKNFKWILEVAKRNPDQKFLIAGDLDKKHFDAADIENIGDLANAEFLGYVSDEKAQNLMQNAKAFLFPSFYEGFGLPPMEVLALGTPVIVSDIPVLREIYGSSAHYIDPHNYDVDLEKILQEPVAPANEVLERFSWEKSAEMLKEVLEEYNAGI